MSTDVREGLADPPAWVADAVVCQIFPDRFCRSGRVAAQQGLALQPWGSPPDGVGFEGGDLYGVIEGLDHLQELAITCLYLNPIFNAAANHRYHAYDYFQVDPLLGGDAAFDALVAELKRRGMRLILDGVFNHCGRGFWAYHHLLENGAASPYADWFITEQWPLKAYPAAWMCPMRRSTAFGWSSVSGCAGSILRPGSAAIATGRCCSKPSLGTGLK